VLMVSLAGRHKEVERLLLAGHRKKVERPLQPNAARDSHNTERKREKKNHHRQAHNNFGAICNSGSGNKNPEPLFMLRIFCRASVSDAKPMVGVSQKRPTNLASRVTSTQRSGPRLGLRL